MPCTKNSKYTNNNDNKTYCTVHAKQFHTNCNKEIALKPFKIQNSNTLDFDGVKMKLMLELEKRNQLLSAYSVVIENQPSFKNPRMKSIASTLYDYYLIRGIIDKNTTNSNINKVKFMAPSNKLKLANDGDTKELVKVKATSETKSYKLTKSLGIKYCLEMIQHLPEWVTHFNSHKKKDDLADAFLQGVYYITTNNIEPNKLVLSFDVGVVHLAYCLLLRENRIVNNENKLVWNIVEWNNIDLTDRSEQNCSCGKKASLYHTIDNIQKYYCKVHSKKIVIEQKSFEHYFKLCDGKLQCQH